MTTIPRKNDDKDSILSGPNLEAKSQIYVVIIINVFTLVVHIFNNLTFQMKFKIVLGHSNVYLLLQDDFDIL